MYDAMAEKNEEKKSEDAEKADGKQSEDKETNDKEKVKTNEDQHNTAEERDEEKKSDVNGSKSESEDKAENESKKESGDKEEEEEAEGNFSYLVYPVLKCSISFNQKVQGNLHCGVMFCKNKQKSLQTFLIIIQHHDQESKGDCDHVLVKY